MEKVKHFFSKPIVHAILIFLCSVGFYSWFYHAFHLSSALTSNGVWKALNYAEYRVGIRSIESGNVLYYTLLDFFRKIFGVNSAKEYYILIIYMNAFFAALLNGSIYLFAHLILKNVWSSFLWMCLHALNPGVFFLAVSSEDIFPAYTLYVWMLFAFYFYVQKQNRMYLLLVCTCLAFTFFFHWTAGVPALLGLVLYLSWENRKNIREVFKSLTIVFSTLFFLFFIVSIYLDYSFLKIWYPGKSMDSMWVSGISLEKIGLVFFNTFSYFFLALKQTNGHFNFSFYSTFIFILIITCCIFSIKLIVKYYHNNTLRPVLILTLIVSILGTVMNLFEQASDPQFFIQTQFIFFLLLFFIIQNEKIKFAIFFFIFFTLIVTLFSMLRKDLDSIREQKIQLIERITFKEKFLFISDGFKPFIPWLKMNWNSNLNASFIDLPSGNQSEVEESDRFYFNKLKDSIVSFVAQDYQVIVLDFLERSPAELGTKFLGYDLTQKMNLIQMYLKTNYVIQKVEDIEDYPIYLLTPKVDE